MSNKIQKIKIINLLNDLKNICQKENGLNYVSGINCVINHFFDDNYSEEEQLIRASYSYKSFLSIKSGFSDFYIDRDNFDERILENKLLDDIKDKLWELLGN